MIVKWCKFNGSRFIYFKWEDCGIQIRACSYVRGNKKLRIRKQFFNLTNIIISNSDNAIIIQLLLYPKDDITWNTMTINSKDMVKMYKSITSNHIIVINDLVIIEKLIKSYDPGLL